MPPDGELYKCYKKNAKEESDQTPHSLGMAGRKRDLLTFPLGVIGRLCSMIMLFLNILYTCSDIRTIMVRSSGVRILMINTALHVPRFATGKMDLKVPFEKLQSRYHIYFDLQPERWT